MVCDSPKETPGRELHPSKSCWKTNAMSPDMSQGLGTAACDNVGYLGLSILLVMKWYELPGVLAPQLYCQGRMSALKRPAGCFSPGYHLSCGSVLHFGLLLSKRTGNYVTGSARY